MRSEAERGIRLPRNSYRGVEILGIISLPQRTWVQHYAAPLSDPSGQLPPKGEPRQSNKLSFGSDEIISQFTLPPRASRADLSNFLFS